MNIYEQVEKIILFGIKNEMIEEIDEILVRNKVLEVLELDEYPEFTEVEREKFISEIGNMEYPVEILDNITKWAGENGRLKEDILVFHDLLNSKIMGQILHRTSNITNEFWKRY